MSRLAPTPLQLTELERSQLQQVVKRHNTPQQIALRANIILLAEKDSTIETLDENSTSVETWQDCGETDG